MRDEWVLRTTLSELETGTLAGEGDAVSQGPAVCDTPTAQVEAESIQVIVTGIRTGDTIRIVLREAGRTPVGARDLGGFANTLRRHRARLPRRRDAGRRP